MIAWESSGEGPPVVLVHGLTEDRRAWDAVVPLLAPRSRCIRLDLRGHGASPMAEDLSPLAMAGDVAAVVAEAGVDEPPLLVGHSLGAVVVTAYAAGAPSRGVVNVDQGLRLGDFATALQPLASMLRGPDFSGALDVVFAALGADSLSADVAAYLDARHGAARPDVVLGVWSQVLDTDAAELTALAEGLLASVTVPYLSIHGGDPGPGYADWLSGALPGGAVVEVWGRGGHYPHLADPSRFADRVAAFDPAVSDTR